MLKLATVILPAVLIAAAGERGDRGAQWTVKADVSPIDGTRTVLVSKAAAKTDFSEPGEIGFQCVDGRFLVMLHLPHEIAPHELAPTFVVTRIDAEPPAEQAWLRSGGFLAPAGGPEASKALARQLLRASTFAVRVRSAAGPKELAFDMRGMETATAALRGVCPL